jgi:hypothetical protein
MTLIFSDAVKAQCYKRLKSAVDTYIRDGKYDDAIRIVGNIRGCDDRPPVSEIDKMEREIRDLKRDNSDYDRDGVIYKNDKCPTVYGPPANKGCPEPDDDGDGIINKNDACPNARGQLSNNGCPEPDNDGDGIINKNDACPDKKGLADNNGCPLPDADGDGYPDKKDKCPREYSKTNGGCPEASAPFYINDYFIDNGNSWLLKNNVDVNSTINNGKFTIESKSNEVVFESSRIFNIDNSKDFTCTIEAKWLDGNKGDAFGLCFCSNASNDYCFFINSAGYFKISRWDYTKKGWQEISPWAITNSINKNSQKNILEIRKIGSFAEFYINNIQVEKIPFDGGFGNQFGIQVHRMQTIEFDNFNLSGMTKSSGIDANTGAEIYSFVDYFNDNKNVWEVLSDDNKKISIEDGKFRIMGIVSGYSYNSVRYHDIDLSKDFSCSVQAEWKSGDNNRSFGIDFCSDKLTNSHYSFFVTAAGDYKILKLIKGAWEDVVISTASPFINKYSGVNYLSIEKKDKKINFYINNKFLISIFSFNAFGSYFGLRVGSNQTVEFDNFMVTGTKK